MGANRELTVKVKADISTASMNPSQAAYPGSPLLSASHGGGASGGANSYGGPSPVLQAENEHRKRLEASTEKLKGFADEITKMTVGFSYLSGSAGSFQKGLEKAANVMAVMSIASSGVNAAKTLMSPSLWAGAGKAIMSHPLALGATAAAASVGYGLYHGSEQGQDYLQGINEKRAAWFGGGRVDARGRFISQDHDLNVIHNKFSEAMRRTAMQAPVHQIEANEREQKLRLDLQYESTKNSFLGFKGYAGNSAMARGSFMSGMSPMLDQSAASLKILHGNTIGALMAEQEKFGATVSARGYGSQEAEARAEQLTNHYNKGDAQRKLNQANETLWDMEKKVAPGDKNMAPENIIKQLELIKNLRKEIADYGAKDVQIQDKINTLVRDQAKAQLDFNTQKLAANQAARQQEAMALLGQKEAFGMMDEGDQMYEKDKADRFKKGGLMALSSEERQSMLSGPLGEDIRMAAKKSTDNGGMFADIYRGSRAEARSTELESQKNQLDKLQVELTKKMDVSIETDKVGIAATVVEAMGKYIADLKIAIANLTEIQIKQANNNSLETGRRKSEANN